MPANLENSAVATGLENVCFHSNPKERQCQRIFKLPYDCTHFICLQSNAQNSPGQASTVCDLPDIQTGFRKGRGTRDQIARSIGSLKKQESSRKTSAIPWSARRSNQSILKEISPEYSLEGLMLKLKLQYFGHLVQKPDSLEKTLMLGKVEGGRRREQQRMRWFDGIINSMDMSLSKLQELGCSDRWQMPLLFGHWQMLFTSASLWLTLCHPGSPSVRCGAVCSVTRTHGHACPTLCDPMDHNLPASSVHGVLQARTLE